MPHASAQSFQISAVNPLSGDQTSIAMGINNAGMLVGTSYDANGNGHAYYLQGGTQTALATLGGSTSEANGISSDGRIAGSSALSSGLTHACYWISGTPADADPANVYGPSCGLTINSAGVLAGYYTNSSSQPQGFTFNGLVLAAVNYPSATQTTVNGINDQGLLVGSYTSSGGVFGFIENGATFQTVPNLSGGTEGQANAVNLATDVAGWVTNSSDQEQAALWRNETLILLGDLGGNYGEAMGLNNYGQVVGASNIAASSYTPAYTANGNTSSFTAAGSLPPMNDSLSHAFLWQNGTLYDLNAFLPGNSGWILQSARGINDSGPIVDRVCSHAGGIDAREWSGDACVVAERLQHDKWQRNRNDYGHPHRRHDGGGIRADRHRAGHGECRRRFYARLPDGDFCEWAGRLPDRDGTNC
jgi:probable HAF family extracellular repeat protein